MHVLYTLKLARAAQLCIMVGIFLLVHTLASAQTLQKPLEGDSLSYAVFFSTGIGWMSYDVDNLNSSLKNSKLNAAPDNAMIANVDTKVQIGKGYLLGSGIYFAPEVASFTNDTAGSIQTVLSSFGASFHLGYTLVQNGSLLVIPSVGLGVGINSTKIKYTKIWSGFPSSNIRDELNSSVSSIVDYSTININLSIGFEAYLKLFSLGAQNIQIQDKPNVPVSVQSRGEIWIGGYASVNPSILSTSGNSSITEDRGFVPSGLQYGIRLMGATALRYILP